MQGSVRKKGNSWYYRYYVFIDGEKKQIERKGGNTKDEALVKLNAEIYKTNTGFFRPKETLFKDYLNMWLEDFIQPSKSANTYYSYQGTIEKYIIPTLGHLPLCDIKVMHIENFLSKLRKAKTLKGTPLTSTTIQKHYLILNSSLNRAVKLQMLNDNPCKYVDTPKRKKFKSNILTLEEIQTIYSCLDLTKYEDYLFFFGMSLTIETGLRRGEMCGLQWSDIDFENKCLSCNTALIREKNIYCISELKTESSYRQLPLSDDIINLLKNHKKVQMENRLEYGELYTKTNIFDGIDYNLIFTNEDGTYCIPSRFLQRLKRLCVHCNIDKNIRWHDLRHSNATILLKSGISMKVIQERLGHSLMQTTSDIYAHVTKEMNTEATNIISNILYKKIREE